MVGNKNKQSQRTKNNTRPSSSGRSAELLSNVPGGIFGFGAVGSEMPGSPAFTMALDIPGAEVDLDFQLVIKKLNKKDPVTKTKALQDMAELVKEKTLEDVTIILPYWTRLYRLLTNDTEHKVRECTQSTHGVIVSKCGRAIAPYLKQMIPIWLTAQYDNYAPAASCAQASMQAAFTDRRLPEVITFCKTEVMNHVIINLVGDNQALFSNTKALTPEIVEMRNQRMIMGTLQGFNFFIKHLPDTHAEWLWNEQLEIFDSSKFWKLATDKCSHIRSAWFGVISRQIERFPDQFGAKYGAKTTRVLVNNLMEKDPLVAMQLWECFLLLTANVKEWYSWVEKKEHLTKRILDLLENGGWGNATHLASIILPLLANLPEEMLSKEFYTQFFTALINGLNKKATLASKSHRQSYLTAIGECLKYVSIHQIDTFGVEIVTSALRTWLLKILESQYEPQVRSNIIKFSATNMVSLVSHWLKRVEEGNEKYDLLVRNFWQNIQSTIISLIDKLTGAYTCQSEDVKSIIETNIDIHILLLKTLNVVIDHGTKRRATIKFHDLPVVEEPSPDIKIEVESKLQEMYKHNLNQLIYQTCAHYLVMADKLNLIKNILVPLYTLLSGFNSKELFVSVKNVFGVKDESLYCLYENVFKKWISGHSLECNESVHIVFLLVPHLNDKERNNVFESFSYLKEDVVEEIICKSLSHPYSTYGYIRKWMKSDVVNQTLISICKRFVESGESRFKNILLMSFSQGREGKMLSDEACSGILGILTAAITDLESVNLDVCASLASQLVTILLAENSKSEASMSLLLQMFQLNATVGMKDDILSEDTWSEVKLSWQDGLSALEEDEKTVFVESAVEFLRSKFITDKENMDVHNVDNVIDLIRYLMPEFDSEFNQESITNEIVHIAKTLFKDNNVNKTNQIELQAFIYSCLTGRINFFCGSDVRLTEEAARVIEDNAPLLLNIDEMNTSVCKCLVKGKYLSMVVFRPGKNTVDEEVTEKDIDDIMLWSSNILANKEIEELYLNVLYDYVVLLSLEKAFLFCESYNSISSYIDMLKCSLKETSNQMSTDIQAKYVATLFARAGEKGFFWSEALTFFNECNNGEGSEIAPVDEKCLFSHKLQFEPRRCFYHHSLSAITMEPIINLDPEINICSLTWSKIVQLSVQLDKLEHMVRAHEVMAEADWDNICIQLCACVKAVQKSIHQFNRPKVVLLAHFALKLLSSLNSFIGSIRSKDVQTRDEKARLAEWDDIVSQDILESIYRLLEMLMNIIQVPKLECSGCILLNDLSDVVGTLTWQRVSPNVQSDVPLSKFVKAALDVFSYTHADSHTKYLTYHLLKGLRQSILNEEVKKYKKWQKHMSNDKEEDNSNPQKPKYSIYLFINLLKEMNEIISNEDFHYTKTSKENDTKESNFSEQQSYVLSYLMMLEFLLDYCNYLAPFSLQQHYIECFGKSPIISHALTNCMKLLPTSILENIRSETPQSVVADSVAALFIAAPKLSCQEPPSYHHLEAFACRCTVLCLDGPGSVTARGWYGAQTARTAKMADVLVSTYITPLIVRRQVDMVNDYMNKRETNLPLVSVKATVTPPYEIIVRYKMNDDDTKMELHIKMQNNHPLVVPTVKSLHAPLNDSQFFSKFVAFQNGTAVETIRMWTGMLSRDVDSVAPCYICYSRLDEDGQLPEKFCSSCRNHYHKLCVFQWFKQSYKASCPICRNPF